VAFSPDAGIFLVVYVTEWDRGGLRGAQIDATRVDRDGNVLDPSGFRVFQPETTGLGHDSVGAPQIAYNGEQFAVVWIGNRAGSNRVYGSLIDPSTATVSSGPGVELSSGSSREEQVAIAGHAGSRSFFVCWNRNGRGRGMLLDGALNTSTPDGLDLSPVGWPLQLNDVAAGRDGYFVCGQAPDPLSPGSRELLVFGRYVHSRGFQSAPRLDPAVVIADERASNRFCWGPSIAAGVPSGGRDVFFVAYNSWIWAPPGNVPDVFRVRGNCVQHELATGQSMTTRPAFDGVTVNSARQSRFPWIAFCPGLSEQLVAYSPASSSGNGLSARRIVYCDPFRPELQLYDPVPPTHRGSLTGFELEPGEPRVASDGRDRFLVVWHQYVRLGTAGFRFPQIEGSLVLEGREERLSIQF